jgi:hypothetical protein
MTPLYHTENNSVIARSDAEVAFQVARESLRAAHVGPIPQAPHHAVDSTHHSARQLPELLHRIGGEFHIHVISIESMI